MATAIAPESSDKLKERVMTDTPFWAEKFGKVIDKNAQLVPLIYKPGQLAFDAVLEGQRAKAKPMRIIVLKARKVGISTATQAKLIHRCTMRPNYSATVVAQDKGTGELLYKIGERLWSNLPEDPWLKPGIGEHRRKRFLHFAGDSDWKSGGAYPDSTYFVDTANEFQSGRGATPTAIHASEVAFWAQIGAKLTALKNSVPRVAETMFVIESTANGYNEFKDIWDDAEQGRSNYAAFFWPWWKEDEYRLDFVNDGERERFIIGDPNHPYAEEEEDLVKNLGLTPEQLLWRRQTIADECNGDVRVFHQEYPATPEEAFIATGQKVFDSYRVAQVAERVERESDPRKPTEGAPGPTYGDFKAAAHEMHPTMTGGTREVPSEALWLPRSGRQVNQIPWKLWLPTDNDVPQRPNEYIVSVDPSGGKTETTDEPDYHAVQVLDHRTREQVAEYRSRIEPDLLAEQILLAALFFNNATIAVERTGGYGMPIIRILANDYHYPHLYRAKRVGATSERFERRYGWDTNVRTKPELIAGLQGLLREGIDGIRSRTLVDEMRTYTRTEKGTTEAEPGRYDDLLMAYMIAHEVASETPMKTLAANPGAQPASFVARSQSLGSYDDRYR